MIACSMDCPTPAATRLTTYRLYAGTRRTAARSPSNHARTVIRIVLGHKYVDASGLGGALPTPRGEPRFGVDRAPLGPVVAPLVPRCALLPAPTPRMMGLRPMCTSQVPNRCVPPTFRTGGRPVE